MTIPFQKPSRSDWVLIGIFWMAALPFIMMDYEVVSSIGWTHFLIGAAWSILIPCLFALTIVYGLVPGLLFRRKYMLFMLLLVVVAFGYGSIYRIVEFWVFNRTPVYTFSQLSIGIESIIRSVGILAALLIGKHFFETQQRLTLAEKERTEAELRHLKAQIDPHFLFNNLNVLGSLIQRSPDQASAYLHRFSALYRYLIRHKDDDVVPLADELAFAADYQYLIGQRFGRAFVFVEKITVSDSLTIFVPPGSIQTLLENAVKHNQGDEQNPLLIELVIDEKSVTVRNDLRPKLTPADSTGTGLTNLRARHSFLSDQPVSVQQNAVEFVVTLPLLRGLPTGPNNLADTRRMTINDSK